MTKLHALAYATLLCTGAALAQVPAAGTAGADASAKIANADSKMMADLAEANIAEVETGKLALEKSKNDQVKTFAQQMIDDHTAALKELQTVAQSKGVKLPVGTDLQHKAMATALRVMSGNTFDNQYVKRVGVGDHERTLKLLQKMQQDGKDADMKALAARMQPKVQSHLQMAQQMDQQMTQQTSGAAAKK